jgi:hypothetical protein
MTIHAMVDLETLGTSPDCVVLTVGAVKFNPCVYNSPYGALYHKIDVDSQIKLGRTIDDSTLDWWNKQDEHIREEALSENNRTGLEDFIKEFNRFCVGVDVLWSQGPLFDFAILQNLYAQLKTPIPWHYWQIRDSRTLFSLMPFDPRKEIQVEAHNALADAYVQAQCVQKTYNHFGIKK